MVFSDLEEMSKSSGGKAIVDFLGRYDPKGCLVVPDPYYSRHTQMFEQVNCFNNLSSLCFRT